MKIKENRHQYALYNCYLYGPFFGVVSDLLLFNSNDNQMCRSVYLGGSYALPSGKDRYFFIGNDHYFTAAEVEIFQISQNSQVYQPTIQASTNMDFSPIPKDVEECFKQEEQRLSEAADNLSNLHSTFKQEENAVKMFCACKSKVIVNLNVSGRIMTVSTFTLGQYPNSVLCKQFANPTCRSSLGKEKCSAPGD